MDRLISSGAGMPHDQNTFLQEHAGAIQTLPRVPSIIDSDHQTCDVFLE